METLTQIWQRLKEQGYESDKGSVHSYLEVYEKLLEPYRHTALNILEIGVFKGDSLRMWSEYFTKATIHGIDISLTPVDGMANLTPIISEMEDEYIPKIQIQIFDAEDEKEVSRIFGNIKFDVIIEDAGHDINQQLNLYRIWRNYLTEDGIYFIEDIQDIDNDRSKFDAEAISVIDLRNIKSRYDDVLGYIRNSSLFYKLPGCAICL